MTAFQLPRRYDSSRRHAVERDPGQLEERIGRGLTSVAFARDDESYRATPPLPAEIAFLVGAGIPFTTLHEAARTAARAGVSSDVALLSGGLVSEASFYRALAKRLGAPFLEEAVSLRAVATPETMLAAGIAPLASPMGAHTHLLAPRGAAIAALLGQRQHRRMCPTFLIASPRHFEGLVRAAHSGEIAHAASHLLPGRDPHLSSLSRLTRAQVGVLCTTSAATGFVLGVAPSLLGLAAGAVFLVAILLRLAAAAASRPLRPAAATLRLADAALPIYTILVPLFREARVVRGLIEALNRIDYPPSRLDIILLVETGDAPTRDALVALGLPTRYRILTVPPGQPQTKPRALNVGLRFARGSLVVVFDAEDTPDQSQLRDAVARFAKAPERLACLQAKLVIRDSNDSWLAKLFAAEYCALFDVVNSGLAALRMPILLGGTSNHFKIAALQKVSGWDAWNVTEDADLGIRLARAGYDVDMLDSSTLEEAPHHWPAWLRQRTRWLKGWMQTLAVHTRTPGRLVRELGLLRTLGCFGLLGGGLLGALVGPIFAVAMVWQACIGSPPGGASAWEKAAAVMSYAVLVLGIVSAAWPIALGRMRRPWLRLWPCMAALPVYWLLVSVAAWLALLELSRWPFRWAKTEHGLGAGAREREARSLAAKHKAECRTALAPS